MIIVGLLFKKGKTMKTIWKWKLQPEIIINMPKSAKILTVQTQNNEPQIWALVDPNKKLYPRTFCVYGTGHKLPDNPGKYINTFQIDDKEKLVFHVFEKMS
jgi:hypothetical protein